MKEDGFFNAENRSPKFGPKNPENQKNLTQKIE